MLLMCLFVLQFCVQACLPTALLVEACPTTAVRMSVIVNYLKSRMEILILNAKTGMDTNSQQYEEMSKDAVNAIKQVCLGVKGVSEKELTELLQAITDAPLNAQYRDELRDLFNQKLSNDPFLSLTSTASIKVDFPENYLRQQDWDMLMDTGADVNVKLLYLATLWANLGLVHPTERSAKNIAALGVLTEEEVVVGGPMGVSHLRTFKKSLKDCVSKIRATNFSNSPGVYTGFVDELQKSYPQWYSQVYSEASPPVGCPAHMHMAVKRMQSTMACRSSRAGCGNLGNPRVGQSTMGNAVQMLLNMQMANQMANQMQVPMEQSLPGLVVYPPRRGRAWTKACLIPLLSLTVSLQQHLLCLPQHLPCLPPYSSLQPRLAWLAGCPGQACGSLAGDLGTEEAATK